MQKRKRIVLKIGSSTLTQGTDRISRGKLEDIAFQIKNLESEYEIVLVSSGAIAAAKQYVKLRNLGKLEVKQALAAIGQVHLMRLYHEVFADYGIPVSQCLLTYYDFKNQDSRSNILNTVDTLLRANHLPIINENDTVATDEIKFGDNDKLAALTAVLFQADLLVLATDIEGLFSADPKIVPGADFIHQVEDISPFLNVVSDSKSELGSGGMKSKLEAAQLAQENGIPTWILYGGEKQFLVKALKSEMRFTKVTIGK